MAVADQFIGLIGDAGTDWREHSYLGETVQKTQGRVASDRTYDIFICFAVFSACLDCVLLFDGISSSKYRQLV